MDACVCALHVCHHAAFADAAPHGGGACGKHRGGKPLTAWIPPHCWHGGGNRTAEGILGLNWHMHAWRRAVLATTRPPLTVSSSCARRVGGCSLLNRLAPLSEDDETEETVLLLKVLGDNVSHVDERAHEHLLRLVRTDPPSPLCAWTRSAASTCVHLQPCTIMSRHLSLLLLRDGQT